MTSIPTTINSQNTQATSLTGIYWVKTNQSLYDVCLQLYGTLDELVNMIVTNGFGGLNENMVQGQSVIFDLKKRQDSLLGRYNFQNNVFYATSFFVIPAPESSYELRDDDGYEMRDDGGYELR